MSFSKEVRPIFNKHCVACHGGVKRAGQISFIVRETLVADRPGGKEKPIQPGRSEDSELIRRVTSEDPKRRMPPPDHGAALSAGQVDILRRWIAAGAPWEPHWAFVLPVSAPPPSVREGWCREPLDRFVLARMEAAGLAPAAAASRREWLRRVSLDLTGLPPSLEEIRAFEGDAGTNAFAAVVDRLLDSPAYGERWATVWLDLARYADSTGFERDPARTIWPWRDWVIRALNRNLPFDAFTVKQLAGDLLPEAEFEDRLAAAFHRNTQNNTEGGTDDEEYRIAAVLDRVNTTFEVWQGLTFKCAQCHAHPYEAIEHDEYYRAAAFFNHAQDWDLREEYPVLKVPLAEEEFASANELDRKIGKLRAAELKETLGLSARTSWEPLQALSAESTLATKLVIGPSGDIRTEGTVAHYSQFTVKFAAPAAGRRITALQLEVLPVDPAKAPLNPEIGFVISRLRAAVVTPELEKRQLDEDKRYQEEEKQRQEDEKKKDGEKPKRKSPKPEPPLVGEVEWAHAFGDEAEPFKDVQGILKPGKGGWGALPRLLQPRRLVLVPAQPVEIPEGAELKVLVYHDYGPGDFAALVMKRFRLLTTANPAWTERVAAEAFVSGRKELADLLDQRSGIEGVQIPVILEQEPQLRRPDAVFLRGNWLDKGQEVVDGIPRVYPPVPPGTSWDRLAFARWLVSTNNPLTARVTVNRLWEQLFGLGLVETVEDFGSSGTSPSHPELLDYLAVRFQRDLNWDLKGLLKELVLSATYRQTAQASPEKVRADPRNRLLARGPRVRLTAEMVRDQALKVSGLLSPKMYGRPVMPPQPEGIWRNAYSDEKWLTATNENRFRRAIYTYVRRTSGYPSYQTFDAPSREVCTGRRMRTNTPLQALVTLNDPVYVECALSLAKHMQADGGDTVAQRIRHGYEAVTGQVPAAADVADLEDLHARALASYRERPEEAQRLGAEPDLAALLLVGSALLNLDAAMNR